MTRERRRLCRLVRGFGWGRAGVGGAAVVFTVVLNMTYATSTRGANGGGTRGSMGARRMDGISSSRRRGLALAGRICPRGRRGDGLCRNLAGGLAFSHVVPPRNLRIACSGAIRVLFPTSIGCISLNSRSLVTNGTSNTRGIVHMGTTIGGFGGRAGVDIVARSNSFCAFGIGCTGRPLVLGVRVTSFVRSNRTIGHPGGTRRVCLGRLNGRDPVLMRLVVGSVRGRGGHGIGRVNDGHFKVRCLLGNVCMRDSLLCFRARVGGRDGIPFSISCVAFGIISGGITGQATVRRRILLPIHTCGCIIHITNGGARRAIFYLPGFAVPSSGRLIIRVGRGRNNHRRSFIIRGDSLIQTLAVGRLDIGWQVGEEGVTVVTVLTLATKRTFTREYLPRVGNVRIGINVTSKMCGNGGSYGTNCCTNLKLSDCAGNNSG